MSRRATASVWPTALTVQRFTSQAAGTNRDDRDVSFRCPRMDGHRATREHRCRDWATNAGWQFERPRPDLMPTPEQAQRQVDNFISTWTIPDTTAMVVQEAVRGVR